MDNLDNKTKIPCAIYTSGLSDEGLDQIYDSYKEQTHSCMAYITSKAYEGLIFSKRYDDVYVSDKHRPSMKQMLEDIKLGRIKCVVVYHTDRLSNSLVKLTKILKLFNDYGVSFTSII